MYKGRHPWKLPSDPTDTDKFFYVAISSEGCNASACNFYDSCIVSVSYIQLCDRFFLATDLFGAVADKHGADVITVPLKDALTASNASFKKQPNGKWRFVFHDGRVVDNNALQRQLYFAGSSGKKGEWTPEQKAHSKIWAACIANIWDHEGARQVANVYCQRVMMNLVMPEAKKILFKEPLANVGNVAVCRALYLSFAANNPTRAEEALTEMFVDQSSPKWSDEWTIALAQRLTFKSGIKIYPVRYDHVRPVIDKMWSTNVLPKTAEELKAWRPAPKVQAPVATPSEAPAVFVEEHPTVPAEPEPIQEKSDAAPEVTVGAPKKAASIIDVILSVLRALFAKR